MLDSNDFVDIEEDTLRSRPLLGPDFMHLQGLNVFELANSDLCERFTHAEMAKLAGNAFCGCQLGVAFLVGLAVLGEYLPESLKEYDEILDHKDHLMDESLGSEVDDVFDEVRKFIEDKKQQRSARRACASISGNKVVLTC